MKSKSYVSIAFDFTSKTVNYLNRSWNCLYLYLCNVPMNFSVSPFFAAFVFGIVFFSSFVQFIHSDYNNFPRGIQYDGLAVNKFLHSTFYIHTHKRNVLL